MYTAPSTNVGPFVNVPTDLAPLFNSLPAKFAVCGELASAVPLVRVHLTVPLATASLNV